MDDKLSMNLNRFRFEDINLPSEMLEFIFENLDNKSLLKARQVCRRWKNIIEAITIPKRVPCLTLFSHQNSIFLNWKDYFFAAERKSFNRNLIRNPNGQLQFKDWVIERNVGDGWIIENTPCGADMLPEDIQVYGMSCFATSYGLCSKYQIIEFNREGCTNTVMDKVRPEIHIEDWFAGRFDCGCWYQLTVSLLGENLKPIKGLKQFQYAESIPQFLGRNWTKVSHVFKDYPPGVRFARFHHEGKDTQFWKGHYGAKFSGSSITVKIPK